MRTIIIIILIASVVLGQNKKGSVSLVATQTARTLEKGRFSINSGMNFFMKTPENLSYNIWQVNGDLAFSYGLTDGFDLTLSTNMYQDTQSADNNLPASISVIAKMGNISLSNRSFLMSTNVGLGLGIGENMNIPFEDYFAEGLSISPSLSFSYFTDQYLPDRAFSLHLTLGYDVFFDNGKVIKSGTNEFNLVKNTSRIHYSLGFVVPLRVFDLMFEIDGYSYSNKPIEQVYGRENRTIANLGFSYEVSNWLNFDFGFGFTLNEEAETTILNSVILDKDAARSGYSKWRGFMGFSFSLQPAGSYGVTRTEVERNEYKRRIQTFKGLIEEENNSEAIEKELDALKEEREKAEKELEELKRILED
jgi:hypothetical protein